MGEEEEVSIKEVADAIVKAIGFQGDYSVRFPLSPPLSCSSKIQFDTTRSDGQFRKPASNKKLLNLIGEFQFTPFEEGTSSFMGAYWLLMVVWCSALDTTVNWFIENYEEARTGNLNKTEQH